MNNGEIAGMLNEEVEKLYPGLYYNTLEIDEKYPGGESPIDFYNRSEKNFNEIINANRDLESIMLVTHSGVINILYHVIRNLEWSNNQKGFLAANTSIHRIVINDNEKYIDIENLKEHLN